jgi:hypothetical protein
VDQDLGIDDRPIEDPTNLIGITALAAIDRNPTATSVSS